MNVPQRAIGVLVALLAASSALAQPKNRQGTTIQLPTFGVSINADGVLRNVTFERPGLAAQRRKARIAMAADAHFAAHALQQ